MKKFIFIILPLIFGCVIIAKASFEENIIQQSKEKMAALKSVIHETTIYPSTEGVGGPDSQYGKSVDIYEDVAIIGAPHAGVSSGAAYVVKYDGQKWIDVITLQPSNLKRGDYFGSSVSIYGDRIIIGSTGADNDGNKSGAVYIYDKVAGVWTETIKILSPSDNIYRFGHAVSLYADRFIVGTHLDHTNGNGVGAAYIYDLNINTWSFTQKITADDFDIFDKFGYSVSLYGDRALIGAVNNANDVVRHGSAYIFDLANGTWEQTSKLTADSKVNRDQFGYSVSLTNNRALVGAISDNTLGNKAGAAFVFEFNNSNWSQTAKLLALDGAQDYYFGGSVSLSGDTIVIGAKQGENGGTIEGGATYVYVLENSSWIQTNKLTPNTNGFSKNFGSATSIYNDKYTGTPKIYSKIY